MAPIDNKALWHTLVNHVGHNVEIIAYGNVNGPSDICLEDLDTSEIILDAGLYTIVPQEEKEQVEPGWVDRNIRIPTHMFEHMNIDELDNFVDDTLAPNEHLTSINVTHIHTKGNETTLHVTGFREESMRKKQLEPKKYLLISHPDGIISPDCKTQIFDSIEAAALTAKAEILNDYIEADDITINIDFNDTEKPQVTVTMNALATNPGDGRYDFPTKENHWHGFNGNGLGGEWQIFKI